MKKHLLKLVLGLCLGVFVVPSSFAKTYKLGHIFQPSHSINVTLEQMAKEVDAATKGEIQFSILHSSVLGGDVEMLSQLLIGSLDACALGGIGIFENMNPLGAVDEVPFLYPNAEAAYRAQDGKFGRLVEQKVIEPLGLVNMGYMENGFRHFTNNKRPITKPEDMKGIKFRSAPVPLRVMMFKELGADAIPISFGELFTALQQGTVDGQENPLAMIDASKFYEVQKYFSLSGHLYTTVPLLINAKVFNSFTPEQQKIVRDAFRKAVEVQRKLAVEAEATLRAKFEKLGVQINDLDKKPFIDMVQPVWQEYIKKNGEDGKALIEAAQNP
jgi:tripartite ATP-independent transporter DctP family solute receptor